MTARFDTHEFGTTVLRLVLGVIFIAHGAQKLLGFGVAGTAGFLATIGVPLPGLMAPLLIGTELLGGILLVLGLFTRYVSIPLAFTMLVALLAVHLPHGFFLPRGYEFVLLVGTGTLTLALQGSGALALDDVLFGRRAAVPQPAFGRA